ncbi:MAG: hypothetical protein RQ826_11935 [Xanthomonadales bacterium]|nr:hypothetical protein [Xanthomonadales bacterium]
MERRGPVRQKRRRVCRFWPRAGLPAWLVLIFLIPTVACADNGFLLEATPSVSTDGSVRLSWAMPENGRVLIQKTTAADFAPAVVLYEGSDSASVITGLADGDYRFRGRLLRADGEASDWSPVVTVRVRHHPLKRALAIFAIGAVVFLGTAWLILAGSRGERVQR